MPRPEHSVAKSRVFLGADEDVSDQDRLDAFRRRQQQDRKRFDREHYPIRRRHRYSEHEEDYDGQANVRSPRSMGFHTIDSRAQSWRDSEGDRLDDFGVDEDVECRDEDEMPLAELLRSKNTR